MQQGRDFLYRWGPSLLLMLAIFLLSGTPGSDLPSFGSFDYYVKKGGHVVGYGLLAVSYSRSLSGAKSRRWQAWLLAVLYAVSDEIHQSFVPGRHPSAVDVALFDATGAAFGLWIAGRIRSPS